MAIITCSRCGATKEGLPSPPFARHRALVHAHTCPECWQAWMEESVRLINHYGLNLVDRQQGDWLADAMKQFLQLPAA